MLIRLLVHIFIRLDNSIMYFIHNFAIIKKKIGYNKDSEQNSKTYSQVLLESEYPTIEST